MPRQSSIYSRLLLAFLLFTSLVILLAVASIWHFDRAESIRQAREEVSSLYISTLRLTKMDADFLATDLTNEQFYQHGSSTLLRQRNSLIYDITADTDSLRDHSAYQAFTIENEVAAYQRMLLAYEEKFDQVVKALLNRGYKDHGTEGTMRDFAHELEQYNSVLPMAELLTLRRHEKDFLLRGDAEYIYAFNKHADKLMGQIPAGKKGERAKSLLIGYKEAFNDLSRLKQEIGLAYQGGLTAELNELGIELGTSFQAIDNLAEQKENELLQAARTNYLWIVAACVTIGLILSHFLTKRITRPLSMLTAAMDEVQARDFHAEHLDKMSPSSSVEIRRLYKAYNHMLKRLNSQLAVINKNSTVLEEQNLQLKEANRRLHVSENRQRQLNNTKDKFFSIIAHDLKGPMATLTSFLKIFITYEQGFTKEEMKGLAGRMYHSTTQLSILLENLLEWSRSQMGSIQYKPTNVSLNKLVENNISLHISRAQEKNINLESDLQEDIQLLADPHMLDFIIRNLLSNALKFTPEEGEVYISADRTPTHIHLNVRDTGIGIPYEEQKLLFQESHHLTRKGTANETGTGLGLLLSKEFAEYHNADISVRSKPGYGTTFTVTIPVIIEEPVA